MQKSKYLIILLFLTVSLKADILYVKKKRCILNDYHFKNSEFNYTYTSNNRSFTTNKFKAGDLEYGYEYTDNKCQKIQVLKDTHMTYADYKFMTALTGLLIGFIIFIFVIFVFIKKD